MQSTTPRKVSSTVNLPKTPSGTGGGRRTTSGGLSTTPRPGTTSAAASNANTPVRTATATSAAAPSSAIENAAVGAGGGIQIASGAGSQNITVAVRVRAFHPTESQELAIRMKDTTCEIHVPGRGRFPFSFDKCFWSNNQEDPDMPYSDQENVFESVGKPLVDNALAGFNSSIIAYGQTGSGKTYSIFGPQNSVGTKDEGLIPRVCNDIFKRLGKPQPGVQHKVFVSVLEIYLEDVYDLLQKRKELKVRGDSTHGFNVAGLKQFEVSEYQEVLKLMAQAENQKTFAATAIHDRSSRAHTLFQLEVRTITAKTTRTATIVLADLAGCERVKAAHTDSGIGFEQAKNINLSLLNLGTCIEAVVTRCRNNQNVHNIGEFRNSTLTKLLKDFIGGNARTAMLVTIAPGLSEQNFSIQALRFADRAKQIQCHAVINSHVNTDAAKIKEEISQLYDKRRELLDKECDLEMQQTMVRKKQADLEKMSFDLLEEKRQLKNQTEKENSAEALLRQKREAEIEAKLKHLQRELNDAQCQKESLDERYLDMCEEQASLQHDKEQITQDHARLLEEVETLKQEHALSLQELELTNAKSMEEALSAQRDASRLALEEAAACQSAKLKAVTIEYEGKMRDQSGRHLEVLAEMESTGKEMRSKLISREEDLALKSRSLQEKHEQCEVLAKAHQKGRSRIESLEADLDFATAQATAAEVTCKEQEQQLMDLNEAHAATICDKAALERDLVAQIENLKSEKVQNDVKFDQVVASLEAEMQDVAAELATTVSMLAKVEAEAAQEKATADGQQSDLAKQLSEMRRELDAKSAALETANGKIHDVTSQNQQLANQIQAEEFAHRKTHMKLNAAVASTDEAEAQLKTTTAALQEELSAEQRKVSNYRKQFYNSKNDRDMIHQQCVAAHNALGLALQSTFQYSEELLTASPSTSFGMPNSATVASPQLLTTAEKENPTTDNKSLVEASSPATSSACASPAAAVSTLPFASSTTGAASPSANPVSPSRRLYMDPTVSASPLKAVTDSSVNIHHFAHSGGDGGAPCSSPSWTPGSKTLAIGAEALVE